MNQNQFDYLRQLGQMGEQLQKMFGQDFIKNLTGSHSVFPNLSALPGISGNPPANPDTLLQNLFQWTGGQHPRVDMFQTRNELIAVFEIPGLERTGDVKVFVEPHRLLVRGNYATRYAGVPQEQFFHSERQRGSFEREISLPVRVIANKARAAYRQGVLEVRMIKDEGSKGQYKGNPVLVDFE